MLEICASCKKIIQPDQTTVSLVKNMQKKYFHARCFGASQLETDQLKKELKDKDGAGKSAPDVE